MKVFLTFIFFSLFMTQKSNSASWCKVIYEKNIEPGDLQKQINKCKNSDNFFIAIHTSYLNAGHLLNTFVAELCDLNREILSTEPRTGDPYYSAVCEFRRHFIRD